MKKMPIAMAMDIVPKSILVEFLADVFALKIIHKSTWHINAILTFTKKK